MRGWARRLRHRLRRDDERLERAVAVKVIPTTAARAEREAEALAAAGSDHPGIVAVFDAGEDGARYLVSELVRGRTLAELVGRGPCRTATSCASASRCATRSRTPTGAASSTATSSRRT